MKQFLSLFIIIASLIACKKDVDTRPPQVQIDEYLETMGLTAEKSSTGLNYIIEEEGVGTTYPTRNSTVTVNYTGRLLNGDIFDSANDISFMLSRVIAGWQEGIPLFKKGGKGVLIIPPSLAYGNVQTGSIPANSVLVFDIELLDFTN